MAPSGECPKSRPERCKNLIEFRALDCLVANCSEKASGDRAWALPFLRRFEQLLPCCDLFQKRLMFLFWALVGYTNAGGVAAMVAEIIRGVF